MQLCLLHTNRHQNVCMQLQPHAHAHHENMVFRLMAQQSCCVLKHSGKVFMGLARSVESHGGAFFYLYCASSLQQHMEVCQRFFACPTSRSEGVLTIISMQCHFRRGPANRIYAFLHGATLAKPEMGSACRASHA